MQGTVCAVILHFLFTQLLQSMQIADRISPPFCSIDFEAFKVK